ncbi:MAG: hypothetical protein ACFFCD_12695 [Promethearchaeota archaeon]
MGKTSGYISLVIGIASLIVGIFLFLIVAIFEPRSLTLAAIALYWAYVNLKGKEKIVQRSPPPIHDPEAEAVVCPHCRTENLTIAKSCRGCGRTLAKTQTDITTETFSS